MKNFSDRQIDWAKFGGSLQDLKHGALDIEMLVIKGAQNLLNLYRERSSIQLALASEFAEEVPGIEYYKKAARHLDDLIDLSEFRQEELTRILSVTRLLITTEEEIPPNKRSLKSQSDPHDQYPYQYSSLYDNDKAPKRRPASPRPRKKKTEE